MNETYGIWGGKHPGSWCHIGIDSISGTKEEAEQQVVVFRKDYPDHAYNVVPFDPNKDPDVPKPKKISRAQLQALKIANKNPAIFWQRVKRNTRDSLFNLGLIAFMRNGIRLTKMGTEFLEKENQ